MNVEFCQKGKVPTSIGGREVPSEFCYYLKEFRVLLNPLSSVLPGTGWNQPWHALAFEPLLTSLPLTKIGIIYTQLLQEEKTVLMLPRSEWSAQRRLKYAQKLGAKLSATIDGYSMVTVACLIDVFSKLFELEASPVQDQSQLQKDKKRRNSKG